MACSEHDELSGRKGNVQKNLEIAATKGTKED
jgi:hypothetical protein